MILLLELNIEGVPQDANPHQIATALGFDPHGDAVFFTTPDGVEDADTAPTWSVISATFRPEG